MFEGSPAAGSHRSGWNFAEKEALAVSVLDWFDHGQRHLLELAGRRNAGDEGGASAIESECERGFWCCKSSSFSDSISST